MKSIWWTIAMLVLAAITLLANKVFAQDQPRTHGAAITINGNTSEVRAPTRAPIITWENLR
jgi:uncharacterized protein YggE